MKKLEKKSLISIIIFIIGIIALIVGLVFLILRFTKNNGIQDGEYLISANNWTLKDEEGVIWDFTEIGKGTLTTNNHTNDYDFVWAIEDNKLKIKTDWLYELENEYDYNLDQGSGTLILKDGESEHIFVANFDN